MSFISASLLAEPPLISLLGEPDQPPLSNDHSYPGISVGKTKSQISMPTLPLTKDLMVFEEQSAGDKLYAEIYQKNLKRFFASSYCIKLNEDDPTSGGNFGKQTASIPSLIDDQDYIDGHSEEPTGKKDKNGKIHTGVYPGFNGGGEQTGKHEKHPKAPRKVEKNEPLLILSDTANSPTSNDSCSSPRSLGSSDEEGRFQFSHAGPVAILPNRDINQPTGVNGSSLILSNATHKESGYLCDIIPDDSDFPDDAVPRDSDYLAGESSSSREEGIRSDTRTPSNRLSYPTSYNTARTPRRIVKINLPHEILHTMQDDPRFDGFCHAWVRRPDFCRHGVNCHFIHDYPVSLVKKFGMVAVYIGPDGREVKDVEKFLELDEVFVKPKRTKLEQGAKEGAPGCYNSNCRDYAENYCKFGQRCWYKHPKTFVEGDRWVTKDVRQLVDGDSRMYGELNEEEEIGTGDRFWDDHQSNTSHEEPERPQKHSQASYNESNVSHLLPSQVYKTGKVAKRTTEHPLYSSFNSEKVDEDDRRVEYDSVVRYKPGSPYAQAESSLASGLGPEPLTSLNKGFKALLVDTKMTTRKPAATQVKYENTSGDYNYWGDESPVEDETDYWKDAPPPVRVSRFSRRQHAIASEAMTYAGLFKQESYRPQKEAQQFIMPPQPVGIYLKTGAPKSCRSKQALCQLVQREEGTKGGLIDIPTFQGPTQPIKKSEASYARHESIFDSQSIHSDGEDGTSTSGLDWTKSLKAMLAQKCEPTKWSNSQGESKVNTLIDI